MHQFDRNLIQMMRCCFSGRFRSSSGFNLRLSLSCGGSRRLRRGNCRLRRGRSFALHQTRIKSARTIDFLHIAGSGRRGTFGDAFNGYAIGLFDELRLRYHIFHRNARTQRLGCGGRLRILLRELDTSRHRAFAIFGSEVFLTNHFTFDNGAGAAGVGSAIEAACVPTRST